MKISSRFAYFVGFIVVCALLGFAAYLQKYKGINPCPLCIFQRLVLTALGIVFLIAAILNLKRTGNIFFSTIAYLIALAGALLAGRQVWLQHLPPGSNVDCTASLDYMMQVFSLTEVFQKVITGSSECSMVDWRFLNLSLAEWSLISFCLFLFFTAWMFFRSIKRPGRIY
jgi:protein dithiol:quinone oxidoreductase